MPAYDRFVCAKLPSSKINTHLYSLVTQHMIHGPCGELNPISPCIRKGYCKFKYPKEFDNETTKGKSLYHIYRRLNIGNYVEIREHLFVNLLIVPYDSFLLSKYNCSINVKISSNIKVIKYIYMYVCKVHDKIASKMI